MAKRLFIFVSTLLLFFPHNVWSLNFYQIQGGFRSLPQSGSLEGRYYYNEKLWTQESEGTPWKFGFWRLGGFAAVHGLAGLSVEVFPISIWQIVLQRSVTSRFYDTKTVDCKSIECRGLLTRGTFKTSLAMGWNFHSLDFFFLPSFEITDLSLSSSNKNFSSETDNLVADRAGDQVVNNQWALGLKTREDHWILLSKNSKMKLTGDYNKSQYLVWNKKKNDQMNYFFGVGTFESTYLKRSPSVVAGVNWTVGENLSLF